MRYTQNRNLEQALHPILIFVTYVIIPLSEKDRHTIVCFRKKGGVLTSCAQNVPRRSEVHVLRLYWWRHALPVNFAHKLLALHPFFQENSFDRMPALIGKRHDTYPAKVRESDEAPVQERMFWVYLAEKTLSFTVFVGLLNFSAHGETDSVAFESDSKLDKICDHKRHFTVFWGRQLPNSSLWTVIKNNPIKLRTPSTAAVLPEGNFPQEGRGNHELSYIKK